MRVLLSIHSLPIKDQLFRKRNWLFNYMTLKLTDKGQGQKLFVKDTILNDQLHYVPSLQSKCDESSSNTLEIIWITKKYDNKKYVYSTEWEAYQREYRKITKKMKCHKAVVSNNKESTQGETTLYKYSCGYMESTENQS